MNDVFFEDKTTTTFECPVSLTDSAVNEIKRLLSEEKIPSDNALRIGVKGGGCSGMSYILGFDKKEENDEEYEIEGIKIIMNRSHKLYLFGMGINYENGLNARGFVFQNPNATKTCGCGSSFSA
ncbi:MAG: iron-sulfur cluster assembly accessory protein [Chitinophagales bacterium]|nr:iron-sulfur cluster assembly accessory protein [Chitinophagales bacterium]